jgi:hypothetical protein
VDLFGFIDIVALTPETTIGIQVTAGSSHASRRTKILSHPMAHAWLACPARSIEVWSFRKGKVKRGGRQTRWVLRREQILPDQLSTLPPTPSVETSESLPEP